MATDERQKMRRPDRVPEWLLERFALGDLPPDRAARVRAQLEHEEDGFERLRALRQSNEEILLRYPPRDIVPAVERRAGRAPRRSSRNWSIVLPLLAAGAAAVGFYVKTGPGIVPAQAPEVIYDKAPPHVTVHRKASGGTERLEPGAIVKARDLLQLGYWAGGKEYGVILSIDGRGGVTLHFPEHPGESQLLAKGGEIPLKHAYELDDAPGFERFFIVADDAPIDIDAVLNNAKALAGKPADATSRYLELPNNLVQSSLTLRKGTP